MNRNVRKVIAAGAALAEFGSLNVYAAPYVTPRTHESDPAQVTIEMSPSDALIHPDLDVMIVSNGVTGDYYTKEEIQGQLDRVKAALDYSTAGARSLGQISITEATVVPEGRKFIWGKDQPCYTDEQYNLLQARLRQNRSVGKAVISMVAYDGNISCDPQGWAGNAISDASNPQFRLNLFYNQPEENELHEIAHLLGIDAKGLGHQALFGCWQYRMDSDGKGKWFLLPAAGTIQQQIMSGCSIKKDTEGEYDWYSGSSAMGNSPDGFGGLKYPSFTPPELARLNPNIRTQLVDAKPGKYYLSVNERDGLFGIRLILPPDHVLRRAIPSAESIYIGPQITGGQLGKSHPLDGPDNTVQISAFVELAGDSHKTVAFDTYLDKTIPSLAEIPTDAAEKGITNTLLVWADSQLGIAAVGGTDKKGQYVELLSIHNPLVKDLMAVEKERSDDIKRVLQEP